jgi:hypothetical protein
MAGVDSVRHRLAAKRVERLAEDATIALAIEFESDIPRRCRSSRSEAPDLAPRSPDPLVVLRPDTPEILYVGIQKAGAGQSVASLARIRCPRGEFGEAHGEGPLHVGAAGELEVVVGDRVAVGIDGGPPLEDYLGSVSHSSGGRKDRFGRRVGRAARGPLDPLLGDSHPASACRLVGVGERVRADTHTGKSEGGHLQVARDSQPSEVCVSR